MIALTSGLSPTETGLVATAVVLDSHDAAPEGLVLVIGLGFFVAVGMLTWARKRYKKYRLVTDTATESVRSMAVGQTELHGRAQPFAQTYPQPFKSGECVASKWQVMEWDEKNPNDDDDSSQGWVPKYGGRQGEKLVLEDETGAVTIEHPPWHMIDRESVTQGRLDNVIEGSVLDRWFDAGPNEEVAAFLEDEDIPLRSSNRRQYRQRVVPVDAELYAFGQATRWDGADEATIAALEQRHETFVDELILEHDEAADEYMVSLTSPAAKARHHRRWALVHLTGALVLLLGGLGLAIVYA